MHPRDMVTDDELTDEARARLAEVAQLYWIEGLKVEEVGHRLHLSRSTVSRLLARARQSGVVEFRIHRNADHTAMLEHRISTAYRVNVKVVETDPSLGTAERLRVVAEAGARYLDQMLANDMTLTVAWGATVEAISNHLTMRRGRGIQVVQYNGSGNTFTSGIDYAGKILERFAVALSGSVHYFPVPALFDSPATREAMWKERSIQRILALRRHADVLLSSVGTIASELPGHLYHSHYLERTDLENLQRQGVVGDLGSVFFRSDGSTRGITLNARSTGMSFDELRRLPIRLLVAAEPAKAAALRASLAVHCATDLVIDDATAEAILASPESKV